MTVGQFQDAVDCSSNSYYAFMGKSGPSAGEGSDVYMNAIIFFKKRQIAGIGVPRKKKAKTESEPNAKESKSTSKSKSNSKENESGSKGTKASSKPSKDDLDVSDITLDGSEDNSVPVHDTPSDLRTKINAHLRDTPATQASFIRALRDQLSDTSSIPQGMSPAALKTYLSVKGHGHGNSSPITYAAYCYFEKLRMKQGKAKSKKRQEMEKVWGPKGMSLVADANRSVIMRFDSVMWTSQYGEVEIGSAEKEPKVKGGENIERKWSCYRPKK